MEPHRPCGGGASPAHDGGASPAHLAAEVLYKACLAMPWPQGPSVIHKVSPCYRAFGGGIVKSVMLEPAATRG